MVLNPLIRLCARLFPLNRYSYSKLSISLQSVKSFAVIGLCATASALMPVSAMAVDFSFAFNNTIGSVSGTVQGRILGLADTGASSATQVFIDSAPSLPGIGPFPVDVEVFYNQININTFTVSGGSIIDASFLATSDGYVPWFYLNVAGCSNCNYLGGAPGIVNNNTFNVWNQDGLIGLNFTPLYTKTTSVPGPLPALGAAAAFGYSRKIRKRIVSSKAVPAASAIL
jgi:hypothetical protein